MNPSDISVRMDWNEERFDRNDPENRRVAIIHFTKQGKTFRSNPEKHAIDLLGDGKEKGLNIELEHRETWECGLPFPWRNAHLPLRKCKMFGFTTPYCPLLPNETIDDNPFNVYMIFDVPYEHFGIIPGIVIRHLCEGKIPPLVPNKNVRKGERMYDLPRDKFQWGKILK